MAYKQAKDTPGKNPQKGTVSQSGKPIIVYHEGSITAVPSTTNLRAPSKQNKVGP